MSLPRQITRLRSRMYDSAKVLGDVQCVLKNRVGKRVAQRIAGKFTRQYLNKIERLLK